MFSLISLFFVLNASANTVLPYHPETDALCFKNADPELANAGVPILGKLGVEQGVCQGIAGVTAAFLENATFVPELPSTGNQQEVRTLIQKLVSLHQSGERSLTLITGSKNIKEFCGKNKKEVMRAAILYNAEIAADEILPLLPQLFTLKKKSLRGPGDQEQLLHELRSIETTLQNGRYPLMLYFKHVVMVTAFNEVFSSFGREIHLTVYDSNHPDEIVTHVYPLEMNGLPMQSNYMVWNLR